MYFACHFQKQSGEVRLGETEGALWSGQQAPILPRTAAGSSLLSNWEQMR